MGPFGRLLGHGARLRERMRHAARRFASFDGSSRDLINGTREEAARLSDHGYFGDALTLLEEHLQHDPFNAGFVLAKAHQLLRWERFVEALHFLEDLPDPLRSTTDIRVAMARASLGCRDIERALALSAAAVTTDARSPDAAAARAVALDRAGKTDEAIKTYEQALALRPHDVECLTGLAVCCIKRSDLERAEALLQRALKASPGNVRAWTALSAALEREGRDDEALSAARQAASLATETDDYGEGLVNLPAVLWKQGMHDEAILEYERSLPQWPSVNAQFSYALALLTTGRLREGFAQYEYRWITDQHRLGRPQFRRPAWSSQELAGRTVLLCAEYGFGDSIQFIRYAADVKALGARVIFAAPDGLVTLAESAAGIDRVIRPGEILPEFDFFAYLMSLPRVFGTEVTTIPWRGPYLRPDARRIELWREKLASRSGLRVGIAWTGNPANVNERNRSIPLSALLPLFQVPNTTFFVLPKDVRPEEIAALPTTTTVNIGPELDFADMAAVVSQLDLVISVCTSVAHLAGALGSPVWTLLSNPADWRWLLAGEGSRWYPTMRLFRQPRPGDWSSVIAQVHDALAARAAERSRTEALQTHSVPAPDGAISASLVAPVPPASPARRHIAEIAQTRFGLLQYFPDDGTSGASLDYYGEWLQAELAIVLRNLPRRAVVVEVGAGIGVHSIGMARELDEHGLVLAYEPRSRFRRVLQQNVAVNGVANVSILGRELGDTAAQLRATSSDSAVTGFCNRDTLDGLRLRRIDWLWIHHADRLAGIIEGSGSTLRRLRPSLLVSEMQVVDVEALARRVRDLGYRCWRLTVPYFNAGNFNRREDDIFQGQADTALLAIPIETAPSIDHIPGCSNLAAFGESDASGARISAR